MILICGESLIDMVQEESGSFTPYVGGGPLNCAIAAAQFRDPSSSTKIVFASGISTDLLGDAIYKKLCDHCITTATSVRSDLPTSLALVTLNADKQPHYSFYREGVADRDIHIEKIIAHLPHTSILQLGSLALVPASDYARWEKIINQAKQQGVVISIDPNCRPSFTNDPKDYRNRIKKLLQKADIVKMSDEDFTFLWPSQPENTFAEKQEISHACLRILTKGESGVDAIYANTFVHVPAFSKLALIDTVGAGDTFLGSLLTQITQTNTTDFVHSRLTTDTIQRMLQLSVIAAGITCNRRGCQPPNKQQTLAYLPYL